MGARASLVDSGRIGLVIKPRLEASGASIAPMLKNDVRNFKVERPTKSKADRGQSLSNGHEGLSWPSF